MPRSASASVSSCASAERYTACAPPTGTCESKITIATRGRVAMLRECRASGRETHRNSRRSTAAYQTGATQGAPASSAVPSVR